MTNLKSPGQGSGYLPDLKHILSIAKCRWIWQNKVEIRCPWHAGSFVVLMTVEQQRHLKN